MLQLTEQSRENHRRFVARVVAAEAVWMLDTGSGAACCESNEEQAAPVLMFWSDRAYAERARKGEFEDCSVESCSLFDFLFRWLPGMADDGALVGTNWNEDLAGTEIEPLALQDEIIGAMTQERLGEYQARLREGIERQNRNK